jgi:hypothetical protein
MRTPLLLLGLFVLPARAQDVPTVDLLSMPKELRPHNISSKGLGCCTFRSAEYAARWQNVPQLFGLPEWMREQGIAGGGYPGKQAAVVEKISRARNLPVPAIVQYEGNDPSIIELALKTGRLPGITWNGNHMLSCVHLDGERGAIVDNNSPHRVQWYSRSEFLRRWKMGGGGWVFILLAPAPPHPPQANRVPDLVPPRVYADRAQYRGEDGEYSWRHGDGVRSNLFRGGVQVGHWDGEKYLPLLAPGKFGEPCEPPCDPPSEELFGLDYTPPGDERGTISDRPATKKEIITALAEGNLDDDSQHSHLTVIGAGRDRVRTDWESHPALAPFKGQIRPQFYSADDWAVSKFGFKTDGSPTVYVQDGYGRVLHRQDDYEGGPEALAKALNQALRRPDPNYRPDGDKDLRKPQPDGGKPGAGVSTEKVVVGGLVGALLTLIGALARGRKD